MKKLLVLAVAVPLALTGLTACNDHNGRPCAAGAVPAPVPIIPPRPVIPIRPAMPAPRPVAPAPAFHPPVFIPVPFFGGGSRC